MRPPEAMLACLYPLLVLWRRAIKGEPFFFDLTIEVCHALIDSLCVWNPYPGSVSTALIFWSL
jgi:hypothetical protein